MEKTAGERTTDNDIEGSSDKSLLKKLTIIREIPNKRNNSELASLKETAIDIAEHLVTKTSDKSHQEWRKKAAELITKFEQFYLY